MAGEVPLIPSQVRRDGKWWPVGREGSESFTASSGLVSSSSLVSSPNLTSSPSPTLSPSSSIPRRRSSFRTAIRWKPLSTINEDKAPSLKSDSTVSLRLNTVVSYQPCLMSQFSEHLVYFYPSQQLQNYQSVSFHCANEACDPNSRLFRTQSQWRTPPQQPYEASTIPMDQSPTSTTSESNAPTCSDYEDPPEPAASSAATEEALPREAIADLFHRVEQYEREHPEVVRDSGAVWVRVNSVGRGLTTRLRTMAWRGNKPSFEARLGHNVPVQSRMRVYEKPSRLKRVEIGIHDCWRRFRNRATGRDTELWTKSVAFDHPYGGAMDVSILSLSLPEVGSAMVQSRSRGLSRAHGMYKGARGVAEERRDSKMLDGEEMKRRKPALFLDVYPSDLSIASLRG